MKFPKAKNYPAQMSIVSELRNSDLPPFLRRITHRVYSEALLEKYLPISFQFPK
jgi:hypothetical protein